MKRTIHTLCGVSLMITGIAKSVSVAEQAPAFSFAFEKRIHNLNVRVVTYRWMSPFGKFSKRFI